MKTREGFVSNSSSSSFIVTYHDMPTSFEIARAMIEIMIEEREKENGKYASSYVSLAYYKDMLSLLGDLEKGMSGNLQFPIHFNSCSFDTYIAAFQDGFHVATCNNEPFYTIASACGVEDFDDDKDNPKKMITWFLDLDEQMMKREGRIPVYCPKCYMMVGEKGKKEKEWCEKCCTNVEPIESALNHEN